MIACVTNSDFFLFRRQPSTMPESATIDPEIFFSIVDQYLRRDEEESIVIGALVGSKSDDGKAIQICNCFPLKFGTITTTSVDSSDVQSNIVNHKNEKTEVTSVTNDYTVVDSEYLNQMYALHRKGHPNDTILGW